MTFDDGTIRYEDRPRDLRVNPHTRETMQEMHLLNAHNTYTGTFLGKVIPEEIIISNDVTAKCLHAYELKAISATITSLSAYSGTLNEMSLKYPTIVNPKILIDGKEVKILDGDIQDVLSTLFYISYNRLSVESFNVEKSLTDGELTFRDPGQYQILDISNDVHMVTGPINTKGYQDISVFISGDMMVPNECVAWMQTVKDGCGCHCPCGRPKPISADVLIQDISERRVFFQIDGQSQLIYMDYDVQMIREPRLNVTASYEDYTLTIRQGRETVLVADFSEIRENGIMIDRLDQALSSLIDYVYPEIESMQEEIQSLGTEVKSLGTNQKRIQSSLMDLGGRVVSMDERLSAVERRPAGTDPRVDILSANVQTISGDLGIISSRLEFAYGDLGGRIDQLDTDTSLSICDLDTRMFTLDASLSQTKKDLDKGIKGLQDTISETSSDLTDAIDEMQKTITSDYEPKILDLRESLVNLDQYTKDGFQKVGQDLDNMSMAIYSDIEQVSVHISEKHDSDMQIVNGKIDDVVGRVNQIDSKTDTIEEHVNTMTEKVDSLDGSIRQLSDSYEDLDAVVTELDRSLNERIGELSDSQTIISSSVEDLEDRLEHLDYLSSSTEYVEDVRFEKDGNLVRISSIRKNGDDRTLVVTATGKSEIVYDDGHLTLQTPSALTDFENDLHLSSFDNNQISDYLKDDRLSVMTDSGRICNTLSILKVTETEYFERLINKDILSNALYIVDHQDGLNLYDGVIRNLSVEANPTSSDAVNAGYVSANYMTKQDSEKFLTDDRLSVFTDNGRVENSLSIIEIDEDDYIELVGQQLIDENTVYIVNHPNGFNLYNKYGTNLQMRQIPMSSDVTNVKYVNDTINETIFSGIKMRDRITNEIHTIVLENGNLVVE